VGEKTMNQKNLNVKSVGETKKLEAIAAAGSESSVKPD